MTTNFIEQYKRRQRIIRVAYALLLSAIVGIGAYILGLSHSQAETQAAREETQRAQDQATDADRLTATALQEMDRMAHVISLVTDICPWFETTAAKVQKAELEIDRNEKVLRRNS